MGKRQAYPMLGALSGGWYGLDDPDVAHSACCQSVKYEGPDEDELLCRRRGLCVSLLLRRIAQRPFELRFQLLYLHPHRVYDAIYVILFQKKVMRRTSSEGQSMLNRFGSPWDVLNPHHWNRVQSSETKRPRSPHQLCVPDTALDESGSELRNRLDYPGIEVLQQETLWLQKQSFLSSSSPICKIDRILKVRNTPKTLSNFQQYRDTIKSKSTKLPKKHPCCIADGNELLRFHSTTFVCSLGLNSSSNLCNSIPNCSVCSIITNGFKLPNDAGKGILTTATSGKAHDSAAAAAEEDGGGGGGGDRRAMLVCRVIAGTVRKNGEDGGGGGGGGGGGEVVEEYDSVAGAAGVYSNLDELYGILNGFLRTLNC
ncbi:hypothetical protein HYC85_019985 [Camellia sinensis]|uniref:PARP catalytic domain-containing protein n=1 Tax=Camellia sinensis TaxID=4442 RepID=A0A7J7GNI3_CAMSI|nr:hypothetical protein HYC85_019985 [Camellia sinensis]